MASSVTFRRVRPGDINRIARRMAAMDALECAACGHTPKQALRLALAASLEAWAGLVDGKPEALFGVVPISIASGHGAPWFLGTDCARSRARLFLTQAPVFLTWMQGVFSLLDGHVHRDNARAIRFLARLGFAVEADVVDIGGEPMRRFWRERHV